MIVQLFEGHFTHAIFLFIFCRARARDLKSFQCDLDGICRHDIAQVLNVMRLGGHFWDIAGNIEPESYRNRRLFTLATLKSCIGERGKNGVKNV